MSLREDYNRDGYVVLRGVLHLNGEYKIETLKNEFEKGIDVYVSYLNSLARGAHTQRILLDVSKDVFFRIGVELPIIISQPSFHVMSPNLRVPDGYYGTGAHQDWSSTQGSLDSVTVWVALTDITLNDFPLEVIPGSHKRGLLEGKMNGSVLEVEADDKEFVPIECRAGDCIFMSGFTVHRTGAGTGFRVAVSQRFDNASEATFIERGYPCAQKRVVDRNINWKPKIEQIRKIYE